MAYGNRTVKFQFICEYTKRMRTKRILFILYSGHRQGSAGGDLYGKCPVAAFLPGREDPYRGQIGVFHNSPFGEAGISNAGR